MAIFTDDRPAESGRSSAPACGGAYFGWTAPRFAFVLFISFHLLRHPACSYSPGRCLRLCVSAESRNAEFDEEEITQWGGCFIAPDAERNKKHVAQPVGLGACAEFLLFCFGFLTETNGIRCFRRGAPSQVRGGTLFCRLVRLVRGRLPWGCCSCS